MIGSVNVPGASAADLAKVKKIAEGAATAAGEAKTAAGNAVTTAGNAQTTANEAKSAASAAQSAASSAQSAASGAQTAASNAQTVANEAKAAAEAAQKAAEEAKESSESNAGGCAIKITFDSGFAGQEYTVTDGDDETYTGIVPDGLVVTVSVKDCNTEYTISAEADNGVVYSNKVTTGPYYGQYAASLTVFTASIVVTAVSGATVTVTGEGDTYTGTAGSDGKATIQVKKSGSYTVKASLSGSESNTATVNVTTSGESYAATVKFSISTVPSQSTSLTYTGSAQSPSWNNYDSNALTLGGTTSGTNAGTYSATFTPKSGFQWSDGTTTAKTVNWTIGKAAGSLSLNKTSMALNGTTPTGTITVTRAGDGVVSAQSSNTALATVSVSENIVTVTALAEGDVTITVSVAAGTNHNAPANKTCSVSITDMVHIFGVSWAKGTSTALSRLTKANDPNGHVTEDITTEPSPAVGTGAGSSPFDNYAPWSGMEEYNIVNNAVSYKKGQSGFSRTSNDTVVYIPEFYFKIVESGGKMYFYVADKPAIGFTKHPGSGKYVGRYQTGASYVSKSGIAPLTNIKRSAARTGSVGKGSKWSQYDYASWCAVWLLYLVEFADWDSQSVIGRGNVDSGSIMNTGGTDSMTYHTGRASGTDGSTQVQYRGIEDPWGNVYEWIDGINFSERAAYVCTNRANYADDTATNYTAAGVTLPSSGWIKDLGVSSAFPWAFLPKTAGGSETTYIPDYLYSFTGWRVLYVGGYCYYESYAGLFYFDAYNASSDAYSYVGARLLFHP